MPVDTLLSFIASERTQSWGFSQKPVGNKGLMYISYPPMQVCTLLSADQFTDQMPTKIP